MPALELWMWITLAIGNVPVYVLVGWGLFGSWGGFWESVKYVLTPDAWSFIKGEGLDDWWESMKFTFFVIACGAAVVGQAFLIDHYLIGTN